MELISLFWRPVLEILILWAVFYTCLIFLESSRAIQLLKGLILIVLIFFLVYKLELVTINWIFSRLLAISVVALLVIFQPEMRRGLTRMGQTRFFSTFIKGHNIIDEIIESIILLSKKKIGAIIVIKREDNLLSFIESGVPLESVFSNQLIETIFTPNTPLHDGAVIVDADRIIAAGCLLPLSQDPTLSRELGTRHRAALGLSEETDAVCIVVSEETGIVSVVVNGNIIRELDKESMAKILSDIYKKAERKQSIIWDIIKKKTHKTKR